MGTTLEEKVEKWILVHPGTSVAFFVTTDAFLLAIDHLFTISFLQFVQYCSVCSISLPYFSPSNSFVCLINSNNNCSLLFFPPPAAGFVCLELNFLHFLPVCPPPLLPLSTEKKIKNSNCLKKRSRNGSAGNWYRGVLAAAAVNPPIAHWPINNISSFSNSAQQQRREIMGQQWTPVKYGAAPSTPPRPFCR